MKISAYDPKEVIKIYANVNELDIISKLDTLKESYIFKAEKVIKHETWDGQYTVPPLVHWTTIWEFSLSYAQKARSAEHR